MLSNQSYHIPEAVMDDERKILEASKKNPERFGTLYERYHEKIFRFIYKRVADKEAAFDITAQVFLNALINLKTYEYKGVPFVSWLYRIACNETIKACKQNEKLRAVHVRSEDFVDLLQDLQEENKEEYYARITQAMEVLNEEELQLIEMRYFENRPFKEIGEIAGVTENNAKVKLYRVIEKLKKKINPKN